MASELIGTATVVDRDAARPTRSTWGLIQLSLFWIANNYHWAAVPIIILPSQIQVFLYQHHPAGLTGTALTSYIRDTAPGTLALVVGPGLIMALIANPFFGYLSDRTTLRWGRRRPYILAGALLNVGGLAIMALAPNIPVLILGLMFTQLANNAAAAPFHAFLPDLVPASQRGKASGYMGLGQMLGSILGFIVPGTIIGLNAKAVVSDGTQTVDQYHQILFVAYAITAAVMVAMAILTVLVVKERPLAERTDMPTAAGISGNSHLVRDMAATLVGIGLIIGATYGIMLLVNADLGNQVAQNVLILPAVVVGAIGVARTFDFRPRQNGDFTWVLVTRGIVMMGIYTVLSFTQYYLQYVTFAKVPNAPSPESAAGTFTAIVIVTAALSTAFAGALSDRLGRKRMVYISGGFMAIVGLLFVLIPILIPAYAIALTYIGAAVFGLGYGAYVSVDWALVTDVLPSEDNFARDMGIWNVALTMPQVFSYVLGALIIVSFNTIVIPGIASFGYTMLFVFLVLYATLGTVTVRFIKGVQR